MTTYYILLKTYFINANHKNPTAISTKVFFEAGKVGTYMLGRKFDDYIIIKQNDNAATVFTSSERDVFKLEKALEEF